MSELEGEEMGGLERSREREEAVEGGRAGGIKGAVGEEERLRRDGNGR